MSGKKRRGKGSRPGPPVHDDLVRREFTATRLDRLWQADITEPSTGEGKLDLCAVKDACSGRAGDNAAMESFFALLQNNILDRRRWNTCRNYAPRSWSGSNGPTTGAAVRPGSGV